MAENQILSKQNQKVGHELAKSQDISNTLRTELAGLKEDHNLVKGQNNQLNKDKTALSNQVESLTGQLNSAQNRAIASEAESKNLNAQNKHLEDTVNNKNADLSLMEKALARAKQQASDFRGQMAQLEGMNNQLLFFLA